jgi:hypothetical protein
MSAASVPEYRRKVKQAKQFKTIWNFRAESVTAHLDAVLNKLAWPRVLVASSRLFQEQ